MDTILAEGGIVISKDIFFGDMHDEPEIVIPLNESSINITLPKHFNWVEFEEKIKRNWGIY